MEHYYQKFVKTLRDFLKDLNRYVPNDGCTQFLECFDRLDMHKVILRYVGIMREHEQRLKEFNESVFTQPLVVFPGINLSELWQKVPNEKKKKLFIYLHTLLVISDMMIQSADGAESNSVPSVNASETNNSSENSEEKKPLEFNPYVGVGGDNVLSVDQMYSGELPEDQTVQKPGLGSLANMVGIDKMLNLKDLTDQLKNMKKEDIDEATNSIKSMLGTNVNEETSNLISDMLTNIQDELKNGDVSSGNPLDNIVKIAESVASKMKPKMDEGGVDMSQLWNSTQNLANQCTDGNGNNLFGNGMNPFDLVNKMMGGAVNPNNPQMPQGNMPSPDQLLNNLPVPPGMTREQYIQQCQQMLDLDLGGLNLNPPNGSKRTGGKRKKR